MGLSQGMEKRNSIEEIYVLRDAQDVVNAAMARCQERQFGKKNYSRRLHARHSPRESHVQKIRRSETTYYTLSQRGHDAEVVRMNRIE